MRYLSFLFVLLFIGCKTPEKELTSNEVLEKSIQKHDPKNQWSNAIFSFRIQEPRLKNPERFSLVFIDNSNNSFMLMRNRGGKTASYQINPKGITSVSLDNKIVEDSLSIQKYMLQPRRVKSYQNFYQMMLGLPMSLNENTIAEFNAISKTVFNGKSSYKVQIKLKEPMFSDVWNLFISYDDFTLLGIEMIFPEEPNKGERLDFEKSIQIGEMTIPRIRHWYELNDTYSGSDVIVKLLE
ncbi:MAG: hypothetical protein JXR05_16855 [Flavobacteriaceae bacterium]